MKGTKTSLELKRGDRFEDLSGKEWKVLEIRTDAFAPGARWIIVRISNGDIDTEIICTSAETFVMAEKVEVLR